MTKAAIAADGATQAQRAAKAAVDAARANVEKAQLDLDCTQVRSPIDGIAGISIAQVGDLVGGDTVLTTVSQVDPIKVSFPVSEQEYLRYADRLQITGGDQRSTLSHHLTCQAGVDGAFLPPSYGLGAPMKRVPILAGEVPVMLMRRSSMKTAIRILTCCALVVAFAAGGRPAGAATAAKIDEDASAALKRLYASSPTAKMLREKAKGILVFPNVIKGGLIIGGQYGQGALRKEGKTVAYYRTVAASYGLQAGGQKFGYALFFMDDASLAYLDKSDGWEIGAGPSVVVVDKGAAKSLGTTASREGVFAFIFGQKGLMAGIGIQGSKITRITPDAK